MSKPGGKPRVLKPLKWKICTEGVTEAIYLREYVKALGIEKYIVINCHAASEKGCGCQHEALLEKMQKCGRAWQYEKIFLVHDYDKADEDKKKKQSFNETFNRVDETDPKINVIYSNPCFEYWLLLHLNYNDSNLNRRVCQQKVKEYYNKKLAEKGKPSSHGDNYKSASDLFKCFGGMAGSNTACDNARKRFERETEKNEAIKHNLGTYKNVPQEFSAPTFAAMAPCTNMFELLIELQNHSAILKK